MMPFARTDRSIIGRWWWTVDHWTLGALLALAAIGVVLLVSGSPAIAEQRGQEPFHFVYRHLMFLPVALFALLSASLLGPREVRWASVLLLVGTVVMLLAVMLFGVEVKGARRWISVGGFSLQPSEFLKPALAVVGAWLFALYQQTRDWRYLAMNAALLAGLIAMVATQPDVGMSLVIVAVWLVQFFLAGMPIWAVAGLGSVAVALLGGAYVMFDHVKSRIDRFISPEAGDTYQIDKSLEGFASGGWLGVGPGNGTYKMHLPDAHTDFVLAVAGEEFGAILCLVLLVLVATVVFRGLVRVASARSPFVGLAAAGLAVSFALQALINMASTLELIPAKGMTLPFVSYGGSSLLAVAVGMGFLLALTRRRVGYEPEDTV